VVLAEWNQAVNNGNIELLTVEDVAALLKVPPSWVYERTRKRGVERIPGFRLGKYWRFREGDVVAWLERQRAGGRANA
jgi:excisionase family DNA binding protein